MFNLIMHYSPANNNFTLICEAAFETYYLELKSYKRNIPMPGGLLSIEQLGDLKHIIEEYLTREKNIKLLQEKQND